MTCPHCKSKIVAQTFDSMEFECGRLVLLTEEGWNVVTQCPVVSKKRR